MIADLGIARVQEQSTMLTRTGMAIGTVVYMSPEQARGREVGPESDVFALGLTLFEVLTGRTIYDSVDGLDTTSGQDVLLYLGSLIHSESELSIQFPRDMRKSVREVIGRACRFSPEERYRDAAEMRTALEAALEAETTSAGRGRLLLTPIAASILLALAAAGYFGWSRWLPSWGIEAEFDSLEELERRVRAVGLEADDFVPPLDRKTLNQLSANYLTGRESLEAAEKEWESGDARQARSSLGAAADEFEQACRSLANESTEALVQKSQEDQVDQMRSYGSLGAHQLAPGAWAEVNQALDATVDGNAGTACALAERHVAQLRATKALTVALANLESALERSWPELAAQLKKEAIQARDDAKGLMVEVAPYQESMDAGSDALSEGDAARSGGALQDAVKAFRRAHRYFREAQVIASATQARAQARALEKKAEDVGLDSVGDASQRIVRADTLYLERSWAEARDAYQGALAGLRDAVGEAPQPPSIVSRSPAEAEARAYVGTATEFSVEAEDPNGDALQFQWFVGGDRQEETGRRFVYRPHSDTDVGVRVLDGQGGEAAANWKLEIRNRKPKLSLRPIDDPGHLTVGETRTFTARAQDPDGDAVTVRFALNGSVVAQGDTYDFVANTPGKFRIEAQASDSRGAITRLIRGIEVSSPQTRGPAETPPPEPKAPEVAALVPTQPAPTPTPGTDPVIEAMEEYQQAYQERDMLRLSRVWMMSSFEKAYLRRYFETCDIRVLLDLKDPTLDGDTASVEFEQSIRYRCSEGEASDYALMRAQLVKRSSGAWQILSITERE